MNIKKLIFTNIKATKNKIKILYKKHEIEILIIKKV